MAAFHGSIMNCNANSNGHDSIVNSTGVVAFSVACDNNKAGGGVDINAPGSTRTGNNPAP